MSKFTFIDLFAGIGGFRLGLEKFGGECLAFSEIDKNAIDVYCGNFNESPRKNLGDVRFIKSLPSHDILTAGVPCQSWSIAGNNLGFNDDRGQLWNDTIYLLNISSPKSFIFENVKGLADPRNRNALEYIMNRIKKAGYFANYYLINSHDYGVPQNRQRVYIIGFRDKNFLEKFHLPAPTNSGKKLFDFLESLPNDKLIKEKLSPNDLFGNNRPVARTKFQKLDELNDFFLFNDIRNGHSTIHSWDLINSSDREKEICLMLLKNRRKSIYGKLDGNPLSYNHFKTLDSSIQKAELEELVKKGILRKVEYIYEIKDLKSSILSKPELLLLEHADDNNSIQLDVLKTSLQLKKSRINITKIINELKSKNCLSVSEYRYEFKFSKISSGINGINRVYLPISDVFSTLVASDTNDFIATENIYASSPEEFKQKFLSDIIKKGNYRKINKAEALIIQGFPINYKLPDNRIKWMKLIGNSVSVPVIEQLGNAILATGICE